MNKPSMSRERAIEVLQDFNDWRRAVGEYEDSERHSPRYSPREIGRAIDTALAWLEVMG